MDLEHEKRLTEVCERSKSNTRRIDEMEKRQDDLEELVSTVKLLADREARMEDDVKEIKKNVNEELQKVDKDGAKGFQIVGGEGSRVCKEADQADNDTESQSNQNLDRQREFLFHIDWNLLKNISNLFLTQSLCNVNDAQITFQ